MAVALLSQLQALALVLRAYTGERLVLAFPRQLFRHAPAPLARVPRRRGTVDSTYRIQYDAPAIQYIAIDGVIPLVTASHPGGDDLRHRRFDWQLALVALAVAPVLFSGLARLSARLRTHSREVKKLESAALSVVQEVLAASAWSRRSDRRSAKRGASSTAPARACGPALRFALAEGGFGLLVGLTTAAGTAAVLFIGVRHVQCGPLTLGELLLVMGYLSQLYAPLKTMSKKAAACSRHLASAERAFALLDEAPDVAERPDARPLARAAGAVTFRDVSFAYATDRAGPARRLLRGPGRDRASASRARPGRARPRLVSLLTRFYDPTAGQILLDGVDLRDYRLADLRNQFAIVLQEPVLFSTSIAENIAYARPGASREEIVAAARAANAHDFIVAAAARATRRGSASAACGSPAASGSASRWPARS